MNNHIDEPNNSIIETSLAELAFSLFFILLIFSIYKINEARSENEALEDNIAFLEKTLSSATEALAGFEEFDPKEIFKELTRGNLAKEKLKVALEEKQALLDRLTPLKALEEELASSLDNIASKLDQFNAIKKTLGGEVGDKGITDKVKVLLQNNTDFKGQNKNLRSKLAKVGNGLDHPPCWADSKTGRIQYIYNVVINETSIEFIPGWPESRNKQALVDPHITQIEGKYYSNKMMWKATYPLYNDSVKQECRHFVRIYDRAKSKNAFKRYLSGIEHHFYKFLSKKPYERSN